jgi:hypothetical protein
MEDFVATSTTTLTLGIRERGGTTPVSTLNNLSMTTATTPQFVVAPPIRRAVLVAGRQPLLVSY